MASSGVGFAGPILAGEEERWRRFLQELAGERREEYEGLLRRLGVTKQKVWLVRSRRGETAVSYLECEEPRQVAARLAASAEPFDVWLKVRLEEFHGCDFARPDPSWSSELVFEAGETERAISEGEKMDVFIVGITGKIGGLLAQKLLAKGDTVRGLVRRDEQRADLAAQGVEAVLGDLNSMSEDALAAAFSNADAVVFCAGTEGKSVAATKAIDDDGVTKVLEATRRAGIDRLAVISVFPEGWRERKLGDALEDYFAAKKRVDNRLTRSGLDWLILRPSLLTDDPGTGTVSLGPAEFHEQVARADVAETLAELLHEPVSASRSSSSVRAPPRSSTPLKRACGGVRAPLRTRY